MRRSSVLGAIEGRASCPVLGGMSPARFLKRYWQKRPLLVRGAFPGFRDPISRDELAGLSCESDVESRLVMERGGAKPWQVLLGPQRAARLRTLPRSHWTLLVQGVDRLVPGVASLLDSFRFLPDWRLDDVMVSFAPVHGGVGPHVDSYDVFLLQGQGRRRWRLDPRPSLALRSGLALRILRKFHVKEEWILEPGDMLYLPPGVGHEGTALEECLTYSIGFRSPSALDLLAAALPRLAQKSAEPKRYRDPALRPARFPGEIPPSAARGMRRLMEEGLRLLDKAEFNALLGEFLTEPKEAVSIPSRSMDAGELRSRLKKGAVLVRSPGSRLAFTREGGSVSFFVNGRRFPLASELVFAAPLLCGEKRISPDVLRLPLRKTSFARLLIDLIRAGVFRTER